MVLLGRAVICSFHRLSTQTTIVSGTVWQRFAMQFLTRGYKPPLWRKEWSWSWIRGLWIVRWRLPISTLHSSHRPISQRFRSAPTCHWQTHGRTDGIGLAKGGNFIGRQTVELCTEIDHCFIQQSIATVQRSKEQATIGLRRSDFLYVPFNANINNTAAVACDSQRLWRCRWWRLIRFILVTTAAAVCS